MKFRVERDALADAVTWAARSLASRPTLPVLAGLLLRVDDGHLTVSGFDLEASTEVDLEVSAGESGTALVSGRLLADITRALPPHPVDVAVDGSRLTIACGSARFSLPGMPVDDYPKLPVMPTTAGTVDGAEFAAAVAQVAIAAGRDDTLPMLTGVRLEIDGDRLTLAATDRYRLAVRELTWNPGDPSSANAQVLVPARTLADAAKSLSHSESLTISLSSGGSGEGIIGFSGTTNGRASRTTTRLLDATFPAYRSLLPSEWASSAELAVSPLVEAVRRVALVTDRNAPVRLEFADASVSLTAGGDDEGRAEEQLEVAYDGDGIVTAFNPQFLLDGLSALSSGTARLLFTSSTKPVVLRPADAPAGDGDAPEYTYLIMPVRLPG
ncbi:DNA polymerase III, beta subunit [Jatrophihabitans endophyticus]|uniref:Beta sliding clamp n=1 Tax=Jatrophihabitans endophyticus TaxID=1206085 RepID=A0A1M5HW67_9ACTN|nr:DNA polymerase III subunit beta [Jatrophihabitans endophyticus]SHG20177.1 DNA polymerase III, beta subunit [Jatrophihabitans endophyticus]